MNTIKAIISCLLFPLLGQAAFYPKDPIKFQKKIEKQVTHHLKYNPQIYYFGDIHSEDQSRVYTALIKEIKKQDPTLDCLFVEMPKRFTQEAIDDYYFRDDYNSITEAVHFVHRVYETTPTEIEMNQRKNVITLAKELKLRTIAVDKLPSPTTIHTLMDMLKEANRNEDHRQYHFALEFETYHYGVKRNRIMAQRMSHAFEQRTCKKAIAINGEFHLRGKRKLHQLNVWYTPLQLLASDKYDLSFRKVMTR